jgi:hypothetical protein
MVKKKLIIPIISLIVIFLLITIFFALQPIPLDQVSLILDDLKEEDFKKFEEEYITEPYIAPNNTVFAGWNILEKYHVRFSKNYSDSRFILIDIGRLESKDKSEEFLSIIRNTSFYSYDFIEIESETIGEESYIGENKTTIIGSKVTLYFIVFRVNDVIVAFISSDFPKDDAIGYVKIIETKLK